MKQHSCLVAVRGGGDLATGVIYRLYQSGFPVVILEIEKPTVIRRTAAFATAAYQKSIEVEGVTAIRLEQPQQVFSCLREGKIPLLTDPDASSLSFLKPDILVDAILAKRNIGTTITMAETVIGLGPGFTAGLDVHAVVETNRGHYLGKVLYEGSAEPDTGTPGLIGGFSSQRVLRAPTDGIVRSVTEICSQVRCGDTIAYVNDIPVVSEIDGTLRGLIMDGSYVTQNLKIGDVDPRCEPDYCYSISDKARAIAGGVLEALLHFQTR